MLVREMEITQIQKDHEERKGKNFGLRIGCIKKYEPMVLKEINQ